MDAIKDLRYDLEHTRQWAIAAEKELYEMKQRALTAEAQLKTNEVTGLQAKIDELNTLVEELDGDIEHWQKCHMNIMADLEFAKEKLIQANQVIEELTQERDGLYETLGITQ